MLNKEKSVEIIFEDHCTECGQCASVCPAEYLLYENKELKINDNSPFGCIQCGHCIMECPTNALKIRGEGISKQDIIELPNDYPDYNELYSLLSKRRSHRKYKNQEISPEIINKILQAASTGAISIPPYEVKVLVINSQEKVREFAEDIVNSFKRVLKVMNPLVLGLMKPFMGVANHKLFKDFVIPLMKMTIDKRKKGKDLLFYDAPAVIIFYTTGLCEGEDAIIASTLAITAAESLGLGTCIIGSVAPTINQTAKLKEKYGLLKTEKAITAFVLGYPEKTFSKGIKRWFKEVRYY